MANAVVLEHSGKIGDNTLVNEYLGGSDIAFEVLVHRYQDKLANYINGIIYDYDRSVDLCQEAFIRYFNRTSPLPLEQAKYWLIRVVKNLSFNYEKRKGRERNAYSKVLNEPRQTAVSGETQLLRKETSALVEQALKKLQPKLRIVLVLREFAGLNYKEIATVLGITEGNVKIRVFRAREQLSRLIDQETIHVSR